MLLQAISLVSLSQEVRTETLAFHTKQSERSRLITPVDGEVTWKICSLPLVFEEHEAWWTAGRPVVSPVSSPAGMVAG